MVKIELFRNFAKSFKNLAKKNKNIINDLKQLEKTLKENPKNGISLGFGLYKIRYLVEIYEKNEIENIPIEKIKEIIKKEME